MRTNAKLTICAVVSVCLIFAQLNAGMLAQDNANDPNTSSVSNVSQNPPAIQIPAPQITPTDTKKPGKSRKKWILIGAVAAAAVATFLLINKSKPEPQVSVGTPSVGVPQ